MAAGTTETLILFYKQEAERIDLEWLILWNLKAFPNPGDTPPPTKQDSFFPNGSVSGDQVIQTLAYGDHSYPEQHRAVLKTFTGISSEAGTLRTQLFAVCIGISHICSGPRLD